MGAYLSQAKTDKESTDEFNDYLVVGASSMQGWRNSQEDAHNSILNYDTKASFFAVYDGHGGAEVSTYCADQFPAFLKTLKSYSEGNYEQALKDAFLGFDKTLLEPDIIETLKVIAAEKNLCQGEDSDAMEDDEDEDLAELHEEGTLPLDEVMEKYKGHPSMPELKKLKENAAPKPQSPYLRGRRAAAIIADAANKAVLDPDCKPEGSSTSKSAAGTASGGSSTQAPPFFLSMKNVALATGDNSAEAEAKASSSSSAAAVPMRSANGNVTTTTIKESEQNGSVSSSEAKVQRYETVTKSTDSSMNISHTSTTTTTNSNEADCESKQNGNSNSNIHSTKETSLSQGETNDAAITSTSTTKEVKIKEKAITMDSSSEEDPEFEARQALEYSGDDEDDEFDENDSDGSEDGGYDEDEDSGEEEEDEESILANENFCANMIEEPGKDSGCTAVVALLVGRDLYVANAGDSRCVVCRNGAAVEMSLDHKPEDAEEFERIVKAGGRVTLDGRVNGGLNLSRALGDHGYKMNADLSAEQQMISALPDIKKLIITPDDEFMVLACDGIWNYMSSEEVVDFVRLRLKTEDKKMSEICEELFETCLAPNTMGDGTGCDNMTAVIIRFKPSILELPSKINPTETEDVIVAQLAANKTKRSTTDDENEAEADQPKAQKRTASPTNREANAEEEKEEKNKAKRIKTDRDMNVKSTSSIVTTTAAANLVASSSSSSTLKPHDDNKSNKNSNEASAAKVTSM